MPARRRHPPVPDVDSAIHAAVPALVCLLRALIEDALAAKAALVDGPALVRSPFGTRQTRALVARGHLRAVKIGRTWYGRREDFEALLPPSRDELPALTPAANEIEERDEADVLLAAALKRAGLEAVAAPKRAAR